MTSRIPKRYMRTETVLGEGMGKVLLCKDSNLDRDVVVKFIDNPREKNRLLDEIKVYQNIRSKHVAQIFDFFSEGDQLGIVLEYISGDDLISLADTILDKNKYLKILFQIASGISDIHRLGIIHRDIKPNNMKFDQEGLIKIFDFGLSRIAGKNDSTLGGFSGTYQFAAPELYGQDHTGETYFSNAIDVYSFGITAWYISGIPLPQQLSEIPRSLDDSPSFNSLPQGIPRKLADMLDLCVAYDPQERPKMEEIVELISKYLLFGKHRALVIADGKPFTLNKIGHVAIRVGGAQSILLIKYDGLEFIVEGVSSRVLVNNSELKEGSVLPKNCVFTISQHNSLPKFVTFDVSNPEVVL
jgi:eukaryotic-like serine/threonine-protein kinase